MTVWFECRIAYDRGIPYIFGPLVSEP